MLFQYKATTKDGRTINGTADVANKQALLTLLRKQEVHPVLISETKAAKSKGLFGGHKKIKSTDLVIFTRQLATMIGAGVPLARALSALQDDSENPYLREVLASVAHDVQNGAPLSEAFAKFPRVFSDVYVNMMKAGEEGGILDEILKRLATQVERDSSIKKRIKSAMMYPLVITGVTVIAFFGIMLFVMPKLAAILADIGGANTKLPVYTEVLLKTSHFFVAHNIGPIPNMLWILIVFAIAGFYTLKYIRTPTGKFKFHVLLLKLPIIKIIVSKVAVARFSRTFSSLMASGVSVLDSLEITGKAIGNKVFEAELKKAAIEVKNGRQLSAPIGESKYFPPIVAQMLLVGEETGQMDTVLTKIADFYEEEVTVMIDGLASIIEPLMIVMLGTGVGVIAASVMGPIANLSKGLGT